MLITGTVENAVATGRRRVFEPSSGPYHGYTDFLFESAPEDPLGPQAFLVHQAPGCTLPTHFHLHHQIQIVVGGGGTLGRHEVGIGSIHYASPESAYGPLAAGAEGLEYFTLRAKTDRGAWYLPGARPAMRAGRRKEQVTAETTWSDARARSCTPIPRRDDGLGAWAYRADAGEAVRCDEAASDAGRFHIVLTGAFEAAGQHFPRFGCLYWTPPGDTPVFRATEADSTLVVVQFPESAQLHEAPGDLPVAPTRQVSKPA